MLKQQGLMECILKILKEKNDNAIFYEQITFNKAISENLKVMDATAQL